MGSRATVVLFDIDGTLITCGGAGRLAFEMAMVEIVGRNDACDFPFAGSTDRAIARQALLNAGHEPTADLIDALLARYLRHLPTMLERSTGYAVHPGVHELLDAIEGEQGLAIGLGTGNIELGARTKLRPGGLDGRFAFGGFGCDHEQRPALLETGARRGATRLGASRESCRVIIVGDTVKDVSAALAIGAECIAVATGPQDGETLRAAGAHHVFDDLRAPELRDVLLA